MLLAISEFDGDDRSMTDRKSFQVLKLEVLHSIHRHLGRKSLSEKVCCSLACQSSHDSLK